MSSSCTFPSSVPTIPGGHDLQARDRTNTLDNDHPLLGMYSQERKGGIGPSMMIVDVSIERKDEVSMRAKARSAD